MNTACLSTVLCISLETHRQFFSMAWLMFRVLQHPWQSGTSEILIGGYQKGKAQPCTSQKLQKVKFSSFYFKLWHLVTLMHLKAQGRVLPFWKPPINISKEPDCHGCCSALNVCQAMLKNCICVSRLMHRIPACWVFNLGTNALFSCIPVIVNISNKKSLAVLNNFEVTLKDTFS